MSASSAEAPLQAEEDGRSDEDQGSQGEEDEDDEKDEEDEEDDTRMGAQTTPKKARQSKAKKKAAKKAARAAAEETPARGTVRKQATKPAGGGKKAKAQEPKAGMSINGAGYM